MEGKGKSKVGSKRKEKPVVEVGFDSGDDEPIGSFLKLKSKRHPKRVKAGLEGRGDKGKGVEKVAIKDEDLVGMDDTLASFRKKLKGAKKDGGGSAAKVVKNLAADVAEPWGQSLDWGVRAEVASGLVSKVTDRIQGNHDGDSVENTERMKDEGSRKKSKRSKVASEPQEDVGVLDGQGPGRVPLPKEKEDTANGSLNCSDDNLDDSLSAFFCKVQSGLMRKARSSVRLKMERSDKVSNDVPVGGSAVVLKDPKISSSALKLINSTAKSAGCLHVELSSGMADVVAVNQGSDDIVTQVPNGGEGNVICCESRQGLSSAPSVANGVLQFDDNINDAHYQAISENTCLSLSLDRSQSSMRACSKEIASVLGHETDCQTNGNKECSPFDNAGSIHTLNGSSAENIYPVSDQKGTKLGEDGVEDNLLGRAIHQDIGVRPTSISASEQIENNQFDELVLQKCRLDKKKQSLQNNTNESVRDSAQAGSLSLLASDAQQKQPMSCVHDDTTPVPVYFNEKLDKVAANSWKEDNLIPEGRLFQLSKQETRKDELTDEIEHQGKSTEKADISHNFPREVILQSPVALTKRCSSESPQNQFSNDISTGACILSQGDVCGDEGANESSSPSTPVHFDSYAEDLGVLSNLENENDRLSDHQRAVRKTKKLRHGDMAYEGDADWEILLHEQDCEKSFSQKDKFDPTLSEFSEAENGAAAAVSVGLKARAVGPVEKIKFKEVLKRKGGLQEYIECRNHILSLWNKDVSRILPLSDCGVSETPVVDELQRATLIRDVYAFLDQCGYINFGVATQKDKAENGGKHNLKLCNKENFGGKGVAHVADTEDGVSFILGKGKTLDTTIVEKKDLLSEVEKGSARLEADGKNTGVQALYFSSPTVPGGCTTDFSLEDGCHDVKLLDGLITFDSTGPVSLSKNYSGISHHVKPPDMFHSDEEKLDIAVPPIPSKSPTLSSGLQSTSIGDRRHLMQCASEGKKRIIVVGAGPAGLAAAHHLQRQGFHVTVLEARSRIGGRVFTDRSSLSVPVDLGASIITGVEADVATERRADPSSLVCAQLGLELTVLNSDCPLYDTVTGQKVPADLDDALEAEYNSLLDDMILLVAQKGEHAMRMSLEEGLEYALKMRRITRAGKNYLENKSLDVVMVSDKLRNVEISEEISYKADTLGPLERRVMDWHFANLEYGCAALLKEVSLPYWNQDDEFGGFGGAHCMIKGGYSAVVESLAKELCIHLNHVVSDISYCSNNSMENDEQSGKVKVSTSNGREFSGDAVLITVPLGCLKAESIKFSPSLPQWKSLSIERLGFGVLNKVVLEFPEVFWDDSIDYFGATAEETNLRGQCFMFWNVKKTVGAPVLIALVVGKAAIDEKMSSADHVNHALVILRKLFGETKVPDPVASVVTDWGKDPYSYGAYSYVAVGSSGEDYDILGRPVENCLFFAGEATCKEHPDTVGGAMISGLREAVRIIDILSTGVDHTAEIEAVDSAERHSDIERNEVRDIITRLEAVELSNVLSKNSLGQTKILTRESLLLDMFFKAKTTAGRLHLVKELLNLPGNVLKSFAGTRGLRTLNSWILDSMGKDGTQLLRHCVRLLVRVSTDLLAVRLSGIGKTVKEKVCVHTSRDIRAIASQLVNVWVEIFRKEKAYLKSKTSLACGKPPLRFHSQTSAGSQLPVNPSTKRVNTKPVKLERIDSKSEVKSSSSQGSGGKQNALVEETLDLPMSDEEKAAFAAAEAARAAALAAAKAYASSGANWNIPLQLPKIPSFHKFARREQYACMDESDIRRNWSAGAIGKQDCLSEIDSRNCRVRDWSIDFSAAGVNLDSSRTSVDNRSQRSHSNEMAREMKFREHSGESAPIDSSLLTKAWVDSSGSVEGKDYNAIERWQCQAAAANYEFYHQTMHVTDEEDSNISSNFRTSNHIPSKYISHSNENVASQVTENKELVNNQPRGPENIKQGVVDYVASLLMPLYKARKIDKDGYKSMMKKTATKVMEQTTDVEKTMAVFEFLDSKRKNKIRAFVDKLIERHMSMKTGAKS